MYKTALRKIFVLSLSLAFVGCSGYSSVYKNHGNGIAHIVVDTVKVSKDKSDVGRGKRRVAQWIYKDLKADFPLEQGKYHVSVDVMEDKDELAVTRDATEERLSLKLTAKITLSHEEKGPQFATSFSVQSHYNVQKTPYGTESSLERARRSAASAIASGVEHRLMIFMAQHTAGENERKH